MPKLTSGLTQEERLKLIKSIDMIKSGKSAHEKQVLQLYRDIVSREFNESKQHPLPL